LDLDREIEPFDEALDRETWSLYNQRLQWDLELATKRRNRPREVADLLENLFKVQDAALAELDKSVGEDEDSPDTGLPDGQLVVQFTSWLLTAESRRYTRRDKRDILKGNRPIRGFTPGMLLPTCH
jgi:Kinetochore protein Mis14 like